ncbi:MAG TPA: phosphotransferase [Anaerolineales bacterium]|nr:phosphotransferase [Anaerolineales bacterium]
MARFESTRVIETGLYEHPAVRAWSEWNSAFVVPERIEILKGKPPDPNNGIERLVCRLVGVGPAGSAVICKRCWRANALVENRIYAQILPQLPFPSLGYYGMLEEANCELCWLFLEDAGENAYSDLIGEHRLLRAQWLSLMHTAAAHLDAAVRLPDKGPQHYLKRLYSVRDALSDKLLALNTQIDGPSPLGTILRQFELLESHWDQVEAFCDGMPPALVHGDFVVKNLRVRTSQAGIALLPFDWGEAGWGVPARDLVDVDLVAYWSATHVHWPWLDLRTLRRLATIGKIFRAIDAIYWLLPSFNYEWLKRPRNSMSIYASWLAGAIQAAAFTQ